MKTLKEMTAEVVENNEAHGWYEKCATFPEAMALLHSEVSEALEAWRKWGLEDKTQPWYDEGQPDSSPQPKRMRDYHGQFGINDSFVTNMNTLHTLIAKASMAWESDDWAEEEGDRGNWTWRNGFVQIFVFLRQLANHYDIELKSEFDRKMAYNRTRPYRHGGKAI